MSWRELGSSLCLEVSYKANEEGGHVTHSMHAIRSTFIVRSVHHRKYCLEHRFRDASAKALAGCLRCGFAVPLRLYRASCGLRRCHDPQASVSASETSRKSAGGSCRRASESKTPTPVDNDGDVALSCYG